MTDTDIKPRRWWIALLLALAAPTGFLYVGKPLIFIVLWLGNLTSLLLLFGIIPGYSGFAGFIAVMAFTLLLAVAAVLGPVLLAIRGGAYRLKLTNRLWVYLLGAMLAVSPSLFLGLGPAVRPEIETFVMSAGSMEPTIRANEYMATDRLGATGDVPERGDIVVFMLPGKPDTFVARLIASGGETVRLVGGVPEVNGELFVQTGDVKYEDVKLPTGNIVSTLREITPEGRSYLITREDRRARYRTTEAITLSPDTWFVLGDNREKANDSTTPRTHIGFGPIHIDEITHIVTGIYWSDDSSRIGTRLD